MTAAVRGLLSPLPGPAPLRVDMHRLRSIINRIHHNNYSLYRGLEGRFDFSDFSLRFDRIQSDPFAPPSQLTLTIPLSSTGFSSDCYTMSHRRTAFTDYISRILAGAIRRLTRGGGGSGNGGVWAINYGGQTILERNSVVIRQDRLEVRLMAGLPAQGRKIDGQLAAAMLLEELPRLAETGLYRKALPPGGLEDALQLAEEQASLRQQLREQDLLAFIPYGAILARRSGVEDGPLPGAVPYAGPPQRETVMKLPDGTALRGTGIPRGIVLITGGAYHGKTTLLQAIQSGVWDHIRGDGREHIVSCPDLVKVRAEDGRAVRRVDISPFVNRLPGGRDTRVFNTDLASGATSQAAGIIEALDMGSRCILMDEDSSATNLLIRDIRMRHLIPDLKEPVTPYLDLARSLYQKRGVSTILALGGNGDFLDVADTVLVMDEYRAMDGVSAAREVMACYPRVTPDRDWPQETGYVRNVVQLSTSRKKREVFFQRHETGFSLGRDRVDLRGYEHITDPTQYDTLAACIAYAWRSGRLQSGAPLYDILSGIVQEIEQQGWDMLWQGSYDQWQYYCAVRPLDIAAALNRLRQAEWDAGNVSR